MTERGWNFIIAIGGVLMIVAIYAAAVIWSERRYERRDREFFKRFYGEPEPETSKGKVS